MFHKHPHAEQGLRPSGMDISNMIESAMFFFILLDDHMHNFLLIQCITGKKHRLVRPRRPPV